MECGGDKDRRREGAGKRKTAGQTLERKERVMNFTTEMGAGTLNENEKFRVRRENKRRTRYRSSSLGLVHSDRRCAVQMIAGELGVAERWTVENHRK